MVLGLIIGTKSNKYNISTKTAKYKRNPASPHFLREESIVKIRILKKEDIT
jgi:hypothetical protein